MAPYLTETELIAVHFDHLGVLRRVARIGTATYSG